MLVRRSQNASRAPGRLEKFARPGSRAFHVPIHLPDGRVLRTLRDAGECIQELPRAIHQRPEWQIAADMLLEAVEDKGPLMFAEIPMRKAVNAGKPAPEPTPRRKGRR